MAKLRSRLKAELGDWFTRLPTVWRPLFEGVELGFEAVDPDATIKPDEEIWPQSTGGPPGTHVFKAYKDLKPDEVRVVIFGNDPYTRISQATGRSFEQGDLTDWAKDIRHSRRVSPSLKSVLSAAAATAPSGAGYSLVDQRMVYEDYQARAHSQPIWFTHVELVRGIADGKIKLPPPRKIFGHWASQGVLWINRTLTYSKWDDDHRESHRQLWAPFTERALEALVTQASRDRRMVFVMWGSSADDLEAPLEQFRTAHGIPKSAVRYVKTGHPQWPEGYFRIGNPLEQINKAIQGPPIAWT
jgi:uracil-DNA glycosylase